MSDKKDARMADCWSLPLTLGGFRSALMQSLTRYSAENALRTIPIADARELLRSCAKAFIREHAPCGFDPDRVVVQMDDNCAIDVFLYADAANVPRDVANVPLKVVTLNQLHCPRCLQMDLPFPSGEVCEKCGYPGLKDTKACDHLELYRIKNGPNAGKYGCLVPGCKEVLEEKYMSTPHFDCISSLAGNIAALVEPRTEAYRREFCRITRGPRNYCEPWRERVESEDGTSEPRTTVHFEYDQSWFHEELGSLTSPRLYVGFLPHGGQVCLVLQTVQSKKSI
jgi:hypothetical protein